MVDACASTKWSSPSWHRQLSISTFRQTKDSASAWRLAAMGASATNETHWVRQKLKDVSASAWKSFKWQSPHIARFTTWTQSPVGSESEMYQCIKTRKAAVTLYKQGIQVGTKITLSEPILLWFHKHNLQHNWHHQRPTSTKPLVCTYHFLACVCHFPTYACPSCACLAPACTCLTHACECVPVCVFAMLVFLAYCWHWYSAVYWHSTGESIPGSNHALTQTPGTVGDSSIFILWVIRPQTLHLSMSCTPFSHPWW